MIGPLTTVDLANLIAGGEDSYVEFKDSRVDNAALAKEMCAFANADGGRIVIGVDDGGGTFHDAGRWTADEVVMNIARTSIEPPLIPAFQRIQWDSTTTLAVVSVERGAERPYAWSDGERRRYFIRVGSTSREATREELMRLTRNSGTVAPDLRPVPGASIDDLDMALVAERFAGRRTIDFEDMSAEERASVLVAAEILHKDARAPTVAGLLCYGEEPQRRLPFAIVSCVAYPGVEVGRETVDRVDVGGRVDQQISGAVEFVGRNVRRGSTVVGIRRSDDPVPSEESIRELVANAVAHRDYGIPGPVQLRVFADRIEVASPGSPPNGVTPASMKVGVSVRRNQFIVQFLEERRLVDALGRGVVLLFEEAAREGLAAPSIAVEGHVTRVTLSLVR